MTLTRIFYVSALCCLLLLNGCSTTNTSNKSSVQSQQKKPLDENSMNFSSNKKQIFHDNFKPPEDLARIAPEYPKQARRFNLEGRVVAYLLIDQNGRLLKAEIIESTADLFSKSALDAISKWTLPKHSSEKPIAAKQTIDFELETIDKDNYAFDTSIRPSITFPKSKSDIDEPLIDGWCEAKLMINVDGNVIDRLILKGSSSEFIKIAQKIMLLMKFEKSNIQSGFKSTSVNTFSIKVLNSSDITIIQKSGD